MPFVHKESSMKHRKRLETFAKAFQEEKGYTQRWEKENYIDYAGYLIKNIGGAGFRRPSSIDGPVGGWLLAWVYIIPSQRRKGHLRSIWKRLQKEFKGFIPEPPYSDEMVHFLKALPENDETLFYVEQRKEELLLREKLITTKYHLGVQFSKMVNSGAMPCERIFQLADLIDRIDLTIIDGKPIPIIPYDIVPFLNVKAAAYPINAPSGALTP